MAQGNRTSAIVRTAIGGVLTAVLGVPFLVLVVMVISAAVGPAAQDPHGYTVIFGTIAMLALVLPLVIAVLLLLSGIRSLRGEPRIEGAGYEPGR